MGPGLGKRAVLCCFGLLSLAQQAVRASPCRPQPLATPLPQREVLVYWSSRLPVDPASWQGLDWARMTTVAVFHPWPPPADMICRAHSAGVRVVNSDGTQWMHTALRSNATHRAAWVESHASQMMASGTDGVNVDLEAYRGGLPGSTAPTPNAAAHLFTELLASLRAGLRRRNPHAQLSIASSVLPTSYPAYFYGGYNMTAIAAEIDFFVVMAYDMNDALRLARRGTASSVPPGHWDEHANAPLPGIIDGVAEYAGLKVGPAQLVLALPWYGYLFTCTNNSRGAYCDIRGDQVHGCPRSACPQISFGQIQALRTNHSAAGPVLRDDDSASVFFEWLNSSGGCSTGLCRADEFPPGKLNLVPLRWLMWNCSKHSSSQTNGGLKSNWRSEWAAASQHYAPMIANGSAGGFMLGDELVWEGCDVAAVALLAETVRADFPSAALYYNENVPVVLHGVNSAGVAVNFSVPPALTMFSFDYYHYDGNDTGAHVRAVRQVYEQHVYPKLLPHQRVLLVPGAFAMPAGATNPGGFTCSLNCFDEMGADDARHYWEWAQTDARIVGLAPWEWDNGGGRLGAFNLPRTRAAWTAIGRKLQGGAEDVSASGTFGFGGPSLRLTFDASNSLTQLTAKGRDFLPGTTPSPMWSLTVTDCKTVFPAFGKAPLTSQFYSPSVRRSHALLPPQGGNSTLLLRWESVAVAGTTPAQLLAVELRLTISAAHPERCSVTGSVSSPAGVCVQTFSTIDLQGLSWHPERGDRLFVPGAEGRVTDCADYIRTGDVGTCGGAHPELGGLALEGSEQRWVPNGGERTMGWMALLAAANSTAGHGAQALYVGAHDPDGRAKLMPAAASGHAALLRVLHAPDSLRDGGATNWTLPYPTVLAVVDGGWWSAAQEYREWSLAHAAWTRNGPLSSRIAQGTVPGWVATTPAWTRGNMDCLGNLTHIRCAELMLEMQRLLGPGDDGKPLQLGMHWYGWNAEQFDVAYPKYTARAGVGDDVAKAQSHGIHVMPYTNGQLMDPTLPEWEDASTSACGCWNGTLVVPAPPTKNGTQGLVPCGADGKPGYYGEKYGNNDAFMGTRAFAVMDPASGYWQRKLGDVAAGVISSTGADALYMDQIAAAHARSCFEAGGGGAGNSWSAGNRAVLRSAAAGARRAHGGRPVALSSESMDEQYISEVSVNLAIYSWSANSFCSAVPAYQAVYGGHVINSRAQRENNDWVAQQRGMLGQQFVNGQALGWMALEELAHWMYNASFAEDMRLFGDMARLRLSAADYLVHGRLWRPPTVAAVAPAAMPNVSVCDWGDAFSSGTPSCCNMTSVLVSAWLSPAGKVALAMVNHQLETVAVTIDVTLPTTQEPGLRRLTARELGPGGSRQRVLTRDDGTAQLQRTLPGRSAAVIELAHHDK